MRIELTFHAHQARFLPLEDGTAIPLTVDQLSSVLLLGDPWVFWPTGFLMFGPCCVTFELVEPGGIEPPIPACKAGVFPLLLRPLKYGLSLGQPYSLVYGAGLVLAL